MVLIILSFFINFSCKKIDILQPGTVDSIPSLQSNKVSQKIFNISLTKDEDIIAIRNRILKQEQQKSFIGKFVNYAGYPVWNKAIIKNGTETTQSKTVQRGGEKAKVIFIPLALDTQKRVNAILRVKIEGADTAFHVLYKWQYKKHGYKENKKFNNADKTALLFMGFENYVFGHRNFKIIDTLLLRNKNNTPTSEISITSFFKKQAPNQRIEEMYWVSICYTVWVRVQNNAKTTSSFSVPMHEIELCNDYLLGGGGDGGGSGSSGSGGGGGGGGSNNGDGWNAPPCSTPVAERVLIPQPCDESDPGWLPIPDHNRDANGYLYSRISELQTILQDFPQALEPCDSLNIMPMEAYGPMWQRVAQYTLPEYVKGRIDSIKSVAPNWVVDNFNLESLENASGPIVNCDYFPVRIKSMPSGMSPQDVMEFFRKNINTFFDPSFSIDFSPYKDGNFYDTAKFNAPFQSSIGSLIHIHYLVNKPSLFKNDGSVILSDYFISNTTGNAKSRFTFSTMETPLDFEHPVAGNRKFGIFKDPAGNGDFVFYTMGVDRTWDWLFTAGNKVLNGFKQADSLWSSMQQKMISFIKKNGGDATFYSQKEYKARPYWDQVEEYLKGNIDFPELKRRLGC
ncbi:MAG: hypothetical protein ABI237_01185 [Ginsengibacter sp.]